MSQQRNSDVFFSIWFALADKGVVMAKKSHKNIDKNFGCSDVFTPPHFYIHTATATATAVAAQQNNPKTQTHSVC